MLHELFGTFSKLFWRKVAYKSIFIFGSWQKRLKKQIFGAEYIFLGKRSQTISECIPNLLGHPVHAYSTNSMEFRCPSKFEYVEKLFQNRQFLF